MQSPPVVVFSQRGERADRGPAGSRRSASSIRRNTRPATAARSGRFLRADRQYGALARVVDAEHGRGLDHLHARPAQRLSARRRIAIGDNGRRFPAVPPR